MDIPGLGRVRKPLVYCVVVFIFLILYLAIISPNLPVPYASSRVDDTDTTRDFITSVKDLPPNAPLVCPNGGTKKNLRCKTINDDKVNYDRAIGQDFVYFLDSLKKKTLGNPSWDSVPESTSNEKSTVSTTIYDIGAHTGYFTFSLASVIQQQQTSASEFANTKFVAIDANAENVKAILKTKSFEGSGAFKHVEVQQAALVGHSAGTGGSGGDCILASSETDQADFHMKCSSSNENGGGNSLEIGSQLSTHSKNVIMKVRAKVDKSVITTLDQIAGSSQQQQQINLARIDVGDAESTLNVLEGSQKTLLSSSSTSSSSQVIAVRLSVSSSKSMQKLLHFMNEKNGYLVYLPSNKSTIPARDFVGNFFFDDQDILYNTFPPHSTSTQITIYFVKGTLSQFLICQEVNTNFILAIVALMIFAAVGYVYFLNARARAVFEHARQSSNGLAALAGGGGGAGSGSSSIAIPSGIQEQLAQYQGGAGGQNMMNNTSNSFYAGGVGGGSVPTGMNQAMGMLDFGPTKRNRF